jgi:cation diffusion facilitator family transporter
MDDRSRLVTRASLIALVGNAVLATLKVAVGIIASSLAVLGDGMDSSTDVLIAIMSLFAMRFAQKPGDVEHPYGHSRAETMATAALAFVVFFAGAQLFLGASTAILSGTVTEMPGVLALWVSGVSIAGKLLLSWSQAHYGKKSGSALLLANAKNMRGDVLTSVAVLVGLSLGRVLGVPLLDRILALLVSLWIVKNAVGIFLDANTELMDGTKDPAGYAEVFAAIATVPEAGNPHRTRIRRMGAWIMIDLDIEVDPSMTVAAAHEIALQVERAIKERVEDVYDIVVHVEPRGVAHEEERFGLKPALPGNDEVTPL